MYGRVGLCVCSIIMAHRNARIRYTMTVEQYGLAIDDEINVSLATLPPPTSRVVSERPAALHLCVCVRAYSIQ